MTVAIEYKLTLLTDAEPDTGLGGDAFDGSVPRDREGRPFLPASHIKGLVREEIAKIAKALGMDGLEARALGRADDSKDEPDARNESLARFSDATLDGDLPDVEFIARTAIDPERGTAKSGALRSFERLPVGTRFNGRVVLTGDGTSREELAIRAGLLALSAIGGGRSRGLGQVVVEITGEKRSPGKLAQDALSASEFKRAAANEPFEPGAGEKSLRLVFAADSPVCCPEKPTVGNVVEGGFSIPASAVRGALVALVERRFGPKAATALYESEAFRAHPALPCASALDSPDEIANLPIPVRVSLSHKVAKLAVDGDKLTSETAEDRPIRSASSDSPNTNPLKAQDGVLLVRADGGVELWKERSMPRVVSEHSSTKGGSNVGDPAFYQTVSVAPLVWSGVVSGPSGWIDAIKEAIDADLSVAFGARRSSLGSGKLFARALDEKRAPWTFGKYANVVVLQAPVALPDDFRVGDRPANRALEDFVRTQWKQLFEGEPKLTVEAVSTSFGALFGWNRTIESGRRSARLVARPGSIFQFRLEGASTRETIGDEERERVCKALKKRGIVELVKKGLGGGVESGCGAVAFHPGVATQLRSEPKKSAREIKSDGKKKELFDECLKIWRDVGRELPSASQIAAVAGIAAKSRADALDYLNEQTVRLPRVWDVWNRIKASKKSFDQGERKAIDYWLEDRKRYSDEDVAFAFKTLGDLVRYLKTK